MDEETDAAFSTSVLWHSAGREDSANQSRVNASHIATFGIALTIHTLEKTVRRIVLPQWRNKGPAFVVDALNSVFTPGFVVTYEAKFKGSSSAEAFESLSTQLVANTIGLRASAMPLIFDRISANAATIENVVSVSKAFSKRCAVFSQLLYPDVPWVSAFRSGLGFFVDCARQVSAGDWWTRAGITGRERTLFALHIDEIVRRIEEGAVQASEFTA